jgi:hypothetical protein
MLWMTLQAWIMYTYHLPYFHPDPSDPLYYAEFIGCTCGTCEDGALGDEKNPKSSSMWNAWNMRHKSKKWIYASQG